jgi:hypothetical protein
MQFDPQGRQFADLHLANVLFVLLLIEKIIG